MKIIISINAAWNIANFRAGLIRALIAEGYEVVAVAPPDEHVARLEDMGCRFVPIAMDNKGTNPAKDAGLFFAYLKVLRRERPAAFLGYTIKPNVYGSLAAHALGIPTLNNVSGLGTAFIRDSWITRVVHRLYRLAFHRSARVFFQNDDDRQLFLDHRLVAAEQTGLLPGSGINLDHFAPRASFMPPGPLPTGPAVPMPAGPTAAIPTPDATARTARCRFLLIARLVYDKGVGEYIEAARIVRAERPQAAFDLLGFLDVDNRTAVSRADVEGWVAEGLVTYLGHADDVRPHIAAADCVVLPSYREGTPRTLLEAAAMAKPLIATDVPGCREVVDDGTTGLLCQVRDSADLAQRMIEMIDMGPDRRHSFGAAGRAKMERQFDERLVITAYLTALRACLAPAGGAGHGAR